MELNDIRRICKLCNLNKIGDEFHYLFECPKMESNRKKHILKHIIEFDQIPLKCTQARRHGGGGGGGGRGAIAPPPMIFIFIFIFFACLPAQRSVMAMMKIPLPHCDNFLDNFLKSPENVCFLELSEEPNF